MRIVVTGATGNVGTSVLGALARDARVNEIVGLARRVPQWSNPRTRWVAADVVTSPLERFFEGADAVIHLAWALQPSHDQERLRAVNVDGSRVFEAAIRAGARALVHASSVGVYSAGQKDRRVDESRPRDGIATSSYSRHKAETERLLDDIEGELRIVRLRPALIFKREAASEIRRLFARPLLPSRLVRPGLLPVLPLPPGLALQAVHSLDGGDAYRLATLSPDARGADNIAAEPVLDAPALGRLLSARTVTAPAAALRAAPRLIWRAHLQPTSPGWLDMGLGVPLMDSTRAIDELGWAPRHSAGDALRIRELPPGNARAAH